MKNLLLLVSILITSHSFSQDDWDVSNPEGDWEFKEHSFSTDEGTWMNLDVSPDGKQIVFDMLGDIWIMPISGGEAKVLREGLAFEIQPRFSPDGKKISFTSDAGGGDNIWTMNVDGSDPKQLTKEDFRLLNNAVWSADSEYIIARKHFTSQRSLGAGEMWMYHMTGGSGIQLTERKNDQQDVNEPCISSDGKYMYYSEDMYPGGYFKYNKDPNKQIYAINQYSFETGEIKRITGGPGGACRPQISPNGEFLAFVKRVRTKTVLYIHNLKTGEEYPVFDGLNKDQQEAWAIFGVYPSFQWMPDNQQIVMWYDGKINLVNSKSLETTNIPFTADVNIKIAKALEFENPVSPKTFTSKVIRHLVTSPDEKTVVFSAVGHLWSKKMPNGKPQRITKASDFEFEPAFSPDGSEIAYVIWNDEGMGNIMVYNFSSSELKQITSEKRNL